jgi:hypothetical protein
MDSVAATQVSAVVAVKTNDRTRLASNDGCTKIVFTKTEKLTRQVLLQTPTFDKSSGQLSLTAKVSVLHTQLHDGAWSGFTPIFVKPLSTLLFEHSTQKIHDVSDSGEVLHSLAVGAVVNGIVHLASRNAVVVSLASLPSIRLYTGSVRGFKDIPTPFPLQLLSASTSNADCVWLGTFEDAVNAPTATVYLLNVQTNALVCFGTNARDEKYEAVSCARELSNSNVIFASIGGNVVSVLNGRGAVLFSDVLRGNRPNSILPLPHDNVLIYCSDTKVVIRYRVTTQSADPAPEAPPPPPALPPDVVLGTIHIHEKSPLQMFSRAMMPLPKLTATVSKCILTLLIPGKYGSVIASDNALGRHLQPLTDTVDTGVLHFRVPSWTACGLPDGWSGRVEIQMYMIILDPVGLQQTLVALSLVLFA